MSRKKPQAGDIVKVKRHPIPYCHYGVYVGYSEVIHLSAPACREKRKGSALVRRLNEKKKAYVHRVTLKEFLYYDDSDDESENDFEVIPCPNDVSRTEVVKRAESAEDSDFRDRKYDVFFNNCEHFARWCHGKAESKQMQEVAIGTAIASAVVSGVALVVWLVAIISSGCKERKEKERPYYT
ncbi:phospholipase A and acyltransferase 3-like [Anneissia japonica]|uniref:phospholipase A and acyltransferase 3-like n=1 Tax=Anneissia japonica TaxID=1529436 RepID=UPI001425A899|nr:phospholipase A and acyltransferase 3-like [Anneissia japonica]